MTLEFTLLMPCLNESETLATCIRKAHQGARAANITAYEVLIADNGSTDGSQAIATAEGARVVNVPTRGYGAALIAGINAAHGSYVIMGDADDSYDWSAITLFVEQLRAGHDLVMGTRLRGKILPGAMPWLHRWLGNPVLTFIGNLLFRARLSDYHCGLRGFQREAIQRLDLHTSGMEFATEMVIKAVLAKLRITEVPITYSPDGRSRPPHLRTWRDGWRHLSFMLVLSPSWVFMLPGLLLILFGILINLLVLPGPFPIGSIILDVHTLLVGNIGLLLGVELITFGIVARTFAVVMNLLPGIADYRWFSLNNGLLLGAGVLILACIPLFQAVRLWGEARFGPLDYQITLRVLIPGVTLAMLGMHIIFASFVLGLIRLRRSD
jgi:glycosyltransferase involved in cell wall biosynthesis